jgi:hypothetical protein
VLQWVKSSANNEPVLRPSATRMRATVFSTSKATVETFPADSKWVLQRLAELASTLTGRAIDCVMKGVSRTAVAAALRVTNKETIKTRKNSPSPKKRSCSISLSYLTISPGLPQPLPQCLPQPLVPCLSQSLAQRLSQPLAPCLSQPLARHLSQPLSKHAPKQPQFLWHPVAWLLLQPLARRLPQPLAPCLSQPLARRLSQPLARRL